MHQVRFSTSSAAVSSAVKFLPMMRIEIALWRGSVGWSLKLKPHALPGHWLTTFPSATENRQCNDFNADAQVAYRICRELQPPSQQDRPWVSCKNDKIRKFWMTIFGRKASPSAWFSKRDFFFFYPKFHWDSLKSIVISIRYETR